MTEFFGILHMIRSDGFFRKNGETKHKELQFMIKTISQFLPLVARIQTKTQTFAGLVTKLKSNNGVVKFTITDCHIDGTSSEKARTYVKEVALDDLIEIQPINKLSTDSLWAQFLSHKSKGEKTMNIKTMDTINPY